MKLLLATQVAAMMGRKLEEGDWSKVYCRAKGIPEGGWSNLHIDVSHKGLGLEMKLLRVSTRKGKALKTVCGTTLMHPAATRSIRIENTDGAARDVMYDVFGQYARLIEQRRERVQAGTPGVPPDMRIGWLIWEDGLTEFLYFEEPMVAPDADDYFAEWNEIPARGVRKPSKSLWIYSKRTKQKRYSVTTSAGIKIQPYFDVPPPSDPNLYYFRVQSEPVGLDTILLWVSAATASALRVQLGSLERDVLSAAVLEVLTGAVEGGDAPDGEEELAVPLPVTVSAHRRLIDVLGGVSDEHRAQLLVRALSSRSA